MDMPDFQRPVVPPAPLDRRWLPYTASQQPRRVGRLGPTARLHVRSAPKGLHTVTLATSRKSIRRS
jgi:hypothetical protein